MRIPDKFKKDNIIDRVCKINKWGNTLVSAAALRNMKVLTSLHLLYIYIRASGRHTSHSNSQCAQALACF